MKNKPKISVIMAIYNGERYLDESIRSILSQTFKDFEFIVINDASTDHSFEIIKKFAKNDKRIKFLNNKENIGLTQSLNKGIKHAEGKYIARQDADDISLPDRLKKQFDFLEKNKNIILCGTNAVFIDENGYNLSQSNVPIHSIKIKRKLKKGNCLIHSSIIFRNKNIYYREKFKYSQDYDLYLNILTMGCEIENLNEILVKSRFNFEAISFNKNYQQKLFANKARNFYIQRLKMGKDDYDNFNLQKILNENDLSKEKIFLEKKIELFLKAGKYNDAKKCLEKYKKLKTVNLINRLPYELCIWIPLIYRIYRKVFYFDQK
jgi:glycosyltransferase involved in cell wall biosynthesis